jgi:putative hydrolase of the HAD superfamily
MSVPSVVIFDLGKVLVDFDYGIAAAKIAQCSNAEPAEVQRLLQRSEWLIRLESGLITDEQFAAEVCASCGFSGTLDEFYEAFADIFSEIKPMTAMHAALRANRIPTCIFSNTNGIATRHIRRRFPFFAHFDNYILSYELGAMKPDEKIYLAAERVTGQKGEAIVYLDDRAENVESGLARGWRVILHETPEKTIPALREMGLPVA